MLHIYVPPSWATNMVSLPGMFFVVLLGTTEMTIPAVIPVRRIRWEKLNSGPSKISTTDNVSIHQRHNLLFI